ncbi:alpha/beta fold hydrolase [Rubrobacter indicoceani]|uniref:alpha/beta fold hydrolase n=1 Tax=Rubrobacter indicoceani TaxID=2051957 RepID=UPI0013C43AD5|nr:alpha/beta hydrolase [Rubrobacter indicoceani]
MQSAEAIRERMEMEYREHRVPRGEHFIYAREYEGEGPAIIPMHGFPDNLHLYDRVAPLLFEAGRRVVVFDFLGWGRSDKPGGYPYTANNQARDFDAVIEHLKLESVVPVAHDASGPPAIDWAMWNRDRVAALILLNTYYSPMPTLRVPEVIRLFSTPVARDAARFVVSRMQERFQWVYRWQVRKFFKDEEATEEFVRVFWEQMEAEQSSFPPLFSLTADLRTTIKSRAGATDSLSKFEWPVRIIFGAEDPYLNTGVAKSFHALFPASELFLLPEAGHFPQLDDPGEVARLILSTPLGRAAVPGGRAVETVVEQGQSLRQI